MSRKNRYFGHLRPVQYRPNFKLYEAEKATWVRRHPDSTPAQYQEAMRVIAQKCGI